MYLGKNKRHGSAVARRALLGCHPLGGNERVRDFHPGTDADLKGLPPLVGQRVDPSLASGDRVLPRRHVTAFLEFSEGWIQRTFTRRAAPARNTFDRSCDVVAMSGAVMQRPKNEELAEGHLDAAGPIGTIRQVCMGAGNVSRWGRLVHIDRLCIEGRCVNSAFVRLWLGRAVCHRAPYCGLGRSAPMSRHQKSGKLDHESFKAAYDAQPSSRGPSLLRWN